MWIENPRWPPSLNSHIIEHIKRNQVMNIPLRSGRKLNVQLKTTILIDHMTF